MKILVQILYLIFRVMSKAIAYTFLIGGILGGVVFSVGGLYWYIKDAIVNLLANPRAVEILFCDLIGCVGMLMLGYLLMIVGVFVYAVLNDFDAE